MNCHYLKLDATHPDYEVTVAALRKSFAEASGADHGVSGPILLADEPESNVDTVRREVSQEAWTGPIPPRGRRGQPGA